MKLPSPAAAVFFAALTAAPVFARPANDDRADSAAVETDAPLTVHGTTLGAGEESVELAAYLEGYRAPPMTVWWKWTASTPGWFLADARGSAVETAVDVMRPSMAWANDRGVQASHGGRCVFEAVAGEVLYLRAATRIGGGVRIDVSAIKPPGRHFSTVRPQIISGPAPLTNEQPLYPFIAPEDVPDALASQKIWWEWQASAAGTHTAGLHTTQGSFNLEVWQETAGGWQFHYGVITGHEDVTGYPDREVLFTTTAGIRWRFACRPTTTYAYDWTGWAKLSLQTVALTNGAPVSLPAEGLSGHLSGNLNFRWTAPRESWFLAVADVRQSPLRGKRKLTVTRNGGFVERMFFAPADAVYDIALASDIAAGTAAAFTMQVEEMPVETPAVDLAGAYDLGGGTGVQPRLRRIAGATVPFEYIHPSFVGGEATPHRAGWCRWKCPMSGFVAMKASRPPQASAVAGMWLASDADELSAVLPVNFRHQGMWEQERDSWYPVEAGKDYRLAIYGGYYISPYGSVDLTLTPLPAAPNDDFNNAELLTPGVVVNLFAEPQPATVAVNEPALPEGLDGEAHQLGTRWWRWPVTQEGVLQKDNRVNVYRGSAIDRLTEINHGDAVHAGETLLLRSVGLNGEKMDYLLQVSAPHVPKPAEHNNLADALTLDSSLPQQVFLNTESATLEAGEAERTGLTALDSVWSRWSAPESGHYVIRGARAFTGSTIADLRRVPPLLTPIGLNVHRLEAGQELSLRAELHAYAAAGTPALISITRTRRFAPANDAWQSRRDVGNGRNIYVSSATGSFDWLTESYIEAGFEPGEPAVNVQTGDTGSVWFAYESDTNGVFALDLTTTVGHRAVVFHAAGTLNEVVPVSGSVTGWKPGLIFTVADNASYHIAVSGPPGEFTLGIRAASAYETWARRFPQLRGQDMDPQANPAGDGYANLVKMALGMDPLTHAAMVAPERLPELVRNGSWLELRYRPDLVALAAKDGGTDAAIHGQTADTSAFGWNSQYLTPVDVGGGVHAVRIPVESGKTKFLRLLVTQ